MLISTIAIALITAHVVAGWFFGPLFMLAGGAFYISSLEKRFIAEQGVMDSVIGSVMTLSATVKALYADQHELNVWANELTSLLSGKRPSEYVEPAPIDKSLLN